MTRTAFFSLAQTFIAIVVLASMAAAQGVQTGIISGVVKDPQGLPLPGATVTVASPALQGSREAVTDAIGAYIIRGLPPGEYAVRFRFMGTTDVTDTVTVPLGGVGEVNAEMRLTAVTETVQVTADLTPPPLAVTQTSANYRADMINALPIGRRPFEIAELAPGVTDNTPNVGQMAIAGGFAFDSIFLIDGVDANDNLFGASNSLFIEDAILETQVLTGGISAEYGRFGGGVVNVITKSGGNTFSGSFRTNLSKASWTQETPFQRSRGQQNSTTLSKFFEGTVGGPVIRDRLWFFNADRYENSATPRTFQQTGGSYDDGRNNKRFEVKITGTPIANHRVVGTFVNNPTTSTNRASLSADLSVDASTLVNRRDANRLWVLNWNGALTNKLFGTFQFSEKTQRILDAGGTSTALTDSPFRTRGNFGLGVPASLHWHAPMFSANDPEERNNRQFAGSLSYFVTHPRFGRHDFKVGGERLNTWRTGGNSQSATNYIFLTDFRLVNNVPVPVWTPDPGGDRTQVQNWIAFPGSTLDIFTTSIYLQDRWQVSDRITADIGARFEDVNTEATGDIIGADTRTWMPRLGISFDIEGNGRTVAQATYGRYSGRFTERAFGRNTNVGTPSRITYSYTGPPGEGHDFAPGYNLSNYVVASGSFPTANVFFADDLTSPKTDEVTLSIGRELPRAGHVKVTYTWRETDSFIDDFIDDPTAAGKTTVIRDGTNFGTFDNVTYRNTDAPIREYQAIQFEARSRVWRLPVQGHYTVQIRNHGNFEGEATNQPGNPTTWHDYPEMLDPARYEPYGRLNEFQRHKFRLWTTYTQDLGRAGALDISPIWRVNSGLTYSHSITRAMSAVQRSLNPGYARANTTQYTMYFGERGSESFAGYGMLDMSLRYGVPVWKSVQPWIQAHVFNVLDNRKLIQWDTTVAIDPNSPLDAYGQPTGFIKGPNYGNATANTHFPVWSSGETGGRTVRLAMGIRF